MKTYKQGILMGLMSGVAVCGAIFALLMALYINPQMENISALTDKTEQGLKARAETCEARFNSATIFYEPKPQPAPALSIPLAGGTVGLSVTVGPQQSTQGQLWPAWFIRAKIEPRTNVPGAQYQWIDLRTGEKRGMIDALPTSASLPSLDPDDK